MESFFWIGIILILGYISNKLSEKLKLPQITLYLLIGMALSPSFLDLLPKDFIADTSWIVDVSLSLIAFVIGGNIKYKKIAHMQKSILYITFFQAQLTFIITLAGLYFMLPFLVENTSTFEDFIFYFSISLFLGALATTTAPTTTLAVIEEYKSTGIVTTALLAIVAIDDILAIINYSISTSIYSSMTINSMNTYLDTFLHLLYNIIGSIFVGTIFALLAIFIIKKVHHKNTLSVAIGHVLLVYSISHFIYIEALLSVMIFGVVLSNKSPYFEYIFKHLGKSYLTIVFMLFFVITGASSHFDVLITMWQIAIVYVLLRAFGKLFGTYIGARLSDTKTVIKDNVGYALIPQAGVALGLAMILYKEFPENEITHIVLNTILATTIIHETIGPLLTKFALKRAGEIK